MIPQGLLLAQCTMNVHPNEEKEEAMYPSIIWYSNAPCVVLLERNSRCSLFTPTISRI
jgi:hypothetical protein